jgi:sugar lactone lactonase YvrE
MTRISAFSLAAFLACSTAAFAADVTVPAGTQPESLTVAPNGAVIFGSNATTKIYRAKKGAAAADVFIDVSVDSPNATFFGVLADAASNTLWACQINNGSVQGVPRKTSLRGFDLKTGAAKSRWDLPGDSNVCNDFSIGPDHALYVSDTSNGMIYRVRPGAKEGELVLQDRALTGIDGITFLNGVLYVNNVFSNNLYRIPLDASGKASKPVEIWMDRLLKSPDGMRAASGKLFVAENSGGRVSMLTIDGEKASVTTLKEGLMMPTAVEPAGDSLWILERKGDKASSIPLPK